MEIRNKLRSTFIFSILTALLIVLGGTFFLWRKAYPIITPNETTYKIGTMEISNPVVVMFPHSNVWYSNDVYVCSDSAAMHVCDSGWTNRPDVFLYAYALASVNSGVSRLGSEMTNYDIALLDSINDTDTIVFRGAFITSKFDVWMESTRLIEYCYYDVCDTTDPILVCDATHPVLDSYRLSVAPHYNFWQRRELQRRMDTYEDKAKNFVYTLESTFPDSISKGKLRWVDSIYK